MIGLSASPRPWILAASAPPSEPVSAGLFLNDAPGCRLLPLHGDEALDQFRPLDARLRFDDAMLGVDTNDLSHRSRIEKHGIAGELLTAHRVPSACNAEWPTFRARSCQRRP